MTVWRRLPPLALAAFALAYLWQAITIPLDPWSAADAINARTLPILYAVALLLVAAALAVLPVPADESSPRPRSRASGAAKRWLGLAGHGIAIVVFGVAIPYVGLWIATWALLLASLLIAGERRLLVLALAPAGTAAVAWLLVVGVLDLYIDAGRLFS